MPVKKNVWKPFEGTTYINPRGRSIYVYIKIDWDINMQRDMVDPNENERLISREGEREENKKKK